MPDKFSGAPTLSDLLTQAGSTAQGLRDNQALELKKRDQLAEFLQKGINPDASGLNNYGQDIQKTQLAGNDFTRQGYDPSSVRSTGLMSAAGKVDPKLAGISNINADDAIKGIVPLAGEDLKAQAAKAALQTKATNNIDSKLQKDQEQLSSQLKPLVKQQQDSQMVKSQLALAQAGNGIASNTVPILIDRFQTQSARGLSPALIQRYGSGAKLTTRLQEAIAEATQGKLGAENAQFLGDIIDEGDKNISGAMKKTKVTSAMQRAARYKQPMPQAYSDLTGEQYQEDPPPPPPGSAPMSPQYQKAPGVMDQLKSFLMGGNQQAPPSPAQQDPAARLKYLQDKKAGRVQ